MKNHICQFIIIIGIVITLLTGCSTAPKVSGSPQIPGMTFIAKNPQGLNEYKHTQTGMIFVYIPGGTFMMGSDEYSDEYEDTRPIHKVAVADFIIGKYEVTQGEWQKIMNNNPSNFYDSDNCPVNGVSWYDCVTFCNNTGLRLPIETEWEYACRAGTTTKYYWGDELNGEYLWYGTNSGGRPHPVGLKKPNGYGLFDMKGNIWEWCQDSAIRGMQIGRIARGRSWSNIDIMYPSTNRIRLNPLLTGIDIVGFRCAASVPAPSNK